MESGYNPRLRIRDIYRSDAEKRDSGMFDHDEMASESSRVACSTTRYT
jgi:hypothetical protein